MKQERFVLTIFGLQHTSACFTNTNLYAIDFRSGPMNLDERYVVNSEAKIKTKIEEEM